jgi:sorbitol-specific phosphotransferase system component IIC
LFFDNSYLFSIGERGEHFVNPQDITRDGGKIYRYMMTGTIPKTILLLGQSGAKAIYTFE